MPSDVRIRFRAESRQARSDISQLKREVRGFRAQLDQSQQSAFASARAVDNFGDEAKEVAVGVTSLGRSIFKTSAEAKRFNGCFRGCPRQDPGG